MYANDPERLQMETARLYKEANFNPLAGCLPTFATLPVFIGLYRALSNAAAEGLLTDGFFWCVFFFFEVVAPRLFTLSGTVSYIRHLLTVPRLSRA